MIAGGSLHNVTSCGETVYLKGNWEGALAACACSSEGSSLAPSIGLEAEGGCVEG